MNLHDQVDYLRLSTQLREWWEILKAVEKKLWKNNELYTRFYAEYQELYRAINKASKQVKNISQSKRQYIMMELWDIVSLAQRQGIIESRWLTSRWLDLFVSSDPKDEKEKAINFRDKKIDDYTRSEAITAMNFLSNNYKHYTWDESDATKLITFRYSSINELDDKYEVRLFQDKLKEKIFPNNEWFTDSLVLGYNKNFANYIVPITQVENMLKTRDIKTIDSLLIANYFSYLNSKGKFTIDQLIKTFGNNIYALRNIWNGDNSWYKYAWIAKERFQELDKWWKLFDAIKIFNSPQDFLSKIKTINDPEQLRIIALLFQENINAIKQKFKRDLFVRFKSSNNSMSDSEINRIIEEIFAKIIQYKKPEELTRIYAILNEYSEKYKLWYNTSDIQNTASQATEYQQNINARDRAENKRVQQQAQATWDKKAQEQAKQEELRLTTEWAMLQAQQRFNQTRQASDIEGYINGTRDIKTDIEEAKKQDKEFKDLYNEAQKQQQAYDKKYPSQGNISLNERQNGGYTPLTYHDGSTFFYQMTSSSAYDIVTPIGNISVSPQEFSVVSSNKDALKNLISFKSTLNQLNLWNLWRYREPIFRSLANTKTLSFETKNDYINEGELKIFLKSIMTSLGKEVDPKKDLREIKQEILQANLGEDPLTRQDEVWISGNSSLEEQFVMMFDPKRDGNFLQNKFEQSLQNKIT